MVLPLPISLMNTAWPALCTAFALVLLLVLIVRYRLQAFVALLVVSLVLGLAAGLSPVRVVEAMGKGVGEILSGVAILLALGSMLGRMLDVSGAAETIARTLVRMFGVDRAPLAILLAAYVIGIPVLFNVGFLLLIPIMWRLQRETGQSLLWYAVPLTFGLSVTHSLVPPHPGIVGAVQTLGAADPSRVMIETIIGGACLGVPMVLAGWFGPGRFWARRQFVTVPESLAASTKIQESTTAPSTLVSETPGENRGLFLTSLILVTLPLILSLFGFGAHLLSDLNRLPDSLTMPFVEPATLPSYLSVLAHPPLVWLRFLGHPTMALLIPTGLAFWLLGSRRGMSPVKLARVAEDALQDVGSMVFLFGAAGAFKQVIQDSGAGEYIARQILALPLSPLIVAFLVAVLMRVALGSATASILTAAALLGGLARSLPGLETPLVLAVAIGVTFMTQPADTGFWLIKEYGNLSVRDVMFRYNGCRAIMALTGLTILISFQIVKSRLFGIAE